MMTENEKIQRRACVNKEMKDRFECKKCQWQYEIQTMQRKIDLLEERKTLYRALFFIFLFLTAILSFFAFDILTQNTIQI